MSTPEPSFDNSLLPFVSRVCGSVLVACMLSEHGISLTDADDHAEDIQASIRTLTDLGISPGMVSYSILASIHNLFLNEETHTMVRNHIAEILWKVLGDPKQGEAPLIYHKASSAVCQYFIDILRPID